MGAFGNFFRSLVPGDDHALAERQYADRESASDAAARRRRERHQATAAKTARKGQRWEAESRQREPKTTGWFRAG